MSQAAPFEILTSPHAKGELRTEVIMRTVVYALAPVVAVATLVFGVSVLALTAATTAACMLTEYMFCRLSHKPSTLNDSSAAITGILLALTLPPGFPLWMGAVGGFVSIGLGKALFGGLGFNMFNPALVGRAFLQTAFPVAITTWTASGVPGRFLHFIPSTLALPFMSPASVAEYGKAVDGFTGATALSLMKFGGPDVKLPHVLDLFTGAVAGSAGETSALVILVCGAYLAWRKMLDWRIPVGMIGSVFILSTIYSLLHPEANLCPMFMVCSGGLMLGAVFMATDMVTSPVTPLGVWIYAIFLGAMTLLIRLKGGLPEGVMYAILLGNALIPQLNLFTQPRVYGVKRIWARK